MEFDYGKYQKNLLRIANIIYAPPKLMKFSRKPPAIRKTDIHLLTETFLRLISK